MDGHDAGVNCAAIPQLGKGGVRLLLDEFPQPLQLPAGELRWPSAAVWLGSDRAPFTPTL